MLSYEELVGKALPSIGKIANKTAIRTMANEAMNDWIDLVYTQRTTNPIMKIRDGYVLKNQRGEL
jgi:hypothetical protein